MSRLDFSKFVFNRLASLVSFVNSGTDIVATNVQTAIAELANRNFGKRYGYGENIVGITTGSVTFQNVQTVTITNAPAGLYRFLFTLTITNDKNNSIGEYQVRHNGTSVRLEQHTGQTVRTVSSFKGNISHASGDLNFVIEARNVLENGLTTVSDAKIECWRVS